MNDLMLVFFFLEGLRSESWQTNLTLIYDMETVVAVFSELSRPIKTVE